MLTSTPNHLVQLSRHPEVHGFALHYGTTRTPLVRVVRDTVHPNMWRMIWPDGHLSDLGNLSRIKDAALVLCERGPPRRNARLLHWKINRCESPSGARTRVLEAEPTHRWGYRPAKSLPGKTAWTANIPADPPQPVTEIEMEAVR